MVISVKPSPVILRFRPGKRYPAIPKRFPFVLPCPVAKTTQPATQETPGKPSGC